jgi:hypothetical protein
MLAAGIKLELNIPLTVTVFDVVVPNVTLPAMYVFAERVVVPDVVKLLVKRFVVVA